jgi:hypothetical protein
LVLFVSRQKEHRRKLDAIQELSIKRKQAMKNAIVSA